jgi:hypothetical protein
MSNALKKDYSIGELEARYNEITQLYDLANELIETVLDKDVADADAQMAAVEPLAAEVLEAADILTEEYIMIAKGVRAKNLHGMSKAKMEGAIRRIYGAIAAYRVHMKNTPSLLKNLKNAADAVVNKIQRQVERVIAVVIDFVQLSLASLMGKAELEVLHIREANVALMMHQMSQGQ